jgi:hypothetical protein
MNRDGTAMDEKYLYHVYGLTVTSNLLLPELPIIDKKVTADVEVVIESGHDNLGLVPANDTEFEVLDGILVFTIQNVARYEVKDGCSICIFPFLEATFDQIRLFLLGTAFGALLLQRGVLPIHGSAIEINGEALISVGPSGIGKSTLAAAWVKQGLRLLTDDVAAVTQTDSVLPMVHPAYPQQKLWKDSLAMLEMEQMGLRKVIDDYEKYRVPVTDRFIDKPMPLRAVIKIEVGESDEVHFFPLNGAEKLEVLIEQTYRFFLVEDLGLTASHFLQCHSIAKQIEVYRLIRPKEGCPPELMIEIIKNTIFQDKVVPT